MTRARITPFCGNDSEYRAAPEGCPVGCWENTCWANTGVPARPASPAHTAMDAAVRKRCREANELRIRPAPLVICAFGRGGEPAYRRRPTVWCGPVRQR